MFDIKAIPHTALSRQLERFAREMQAENLLGLMEEAEVERGVVNPEAARVLAVFQLPCGLWAVESKATSYVFDRRFRSRDDALAWVGTMGGA